MKTALIKTSFWDDDQIYNLNIDTKMLYIFLFTAPPRNTTRFYKMSDRLIAAHIGLTDHALRLCKKQLEDDGLVFFTDGWIILGESSYVKPSTGKLSQTIYQQDVDNVPGHIKQFALDRNLNFELSTEKTSGAALEYKDKDNNKVISLPVDNFESGDRFSNKEMIWDVNEKGEAVYKR